MVAVIINTSSAFYVYFIMPHPYQEATHRRIYRRIVKNLCLGIEVAKAEYKEFCVIYTV